MLPAALLSAVLFSTLIGFSPSLCSPRSTPPPSAPEAELVRDAPLYPPLYDDPLIETIDEDLTSQPIEATEDQPYDLGTTLPEVQNDLDESEIIESYLNDDVIKKYLEPNPDLIKNHANLDSNIDYSASLEVNLDNTEAVDENDINEKLDESKTDATKVQSDEERVKRSSTQDWDKGPKTNNRRVKTADTILNIRGAVRDAIGDAGAAPGGARSSRLDAFVIRPAQHARQQPMGDQPRGHTSGGKAPRHDRELLVSPHERAEIPCELNNVTDIHWYKDKEALSLTSSPNEAVYQSARSLVIPRATRSDAALWRCSGKDRHGNSISGKPSQLLIYEPVRAVYLAVDGRRLDAGNTWVPVRDKTVLDVRCVAEGGVPPPELTWHLTALEPQLDHRPYLRILPTNYSIDGVTIGQVSITGARELHNGTLQCGATQRTPAVTDAAAGPASSAKLEIHVTYPPSFVISRWPGFGVGLISGASAALRCDVDSNPPARAYWHRDTPPHETTPLESGGDTLGAATLRWGSLREAHAGWYRCQAHWMDTEYSSIGYYLNVMGAEISTESGAEAEEEEPEHQRVEVPLGGNVQLHCPKGSVGCWWRRVVGNGSAWAAAGSARAHGVLAVKDALFQEAGEYRCVGARAGDVQRLRELKRVTLVVTGGATATPLSTTPTPRGWRLECGACGRGVRAAWLRGGAAERADLQPGLSQHCWVATLYVQEPDEVWCVVVGQEGSAVAVFPHRSSPTPSPARHSVRALHNSATLVRHCYVLVVSLMIMY